VTTTTALLPASPAPPAAPAFTDEAVPGVAHLRRIVGPYGGHEFVAVEKAAKRLAHLEALWNESQARRAAQVAAVERLREGR
jgi:hypothetical protein